MLDELLGRADLKAEIAALTEERDSLESRLSAEIDRRKEAVRDRQAAEKRVNQLEDRIAGLEGELEHLRGGEDEVSFRAVRTLTRERTRTIIDRLSSIQAGPEGAYTAGVTDGVPEDAGALLGDRAPLIDRASPCIFCADDAGVVVAMLSAPRHPGTFETWEEEFRLEPEWFLPMGRFAFAVVRADLFACGVYEGDKRVEFEGFESDVMGRHSKGGFSQARFERRREEQVATHREAVEDALGEIAVEELILVGDRRTIGDLDIDASVTATVDASGKPSEALEDAFDTFWRARLSLP